MRLIDADKIVKQLEDKKINPQTTFLNTVLIGLLNTAPEVDIKTEVAREIFAETEEILFDYENVIREEYRNAFETRFAELKNKYIGGVGE